MHFEVTNNLLFETHSRLFSFQLYIQIHHQLNNFNEQYTSYLLELLKQNKLLLIKNNNNSSHMIL